MRKMYRSFFALFIVLFGVFTINLEESKAAMKQPQKATWLWHTETIIDQADEQLAFLVEQEATVVYLQVNRSIQAKAYHAFIQKANALGIEVHALDGSSKWVRTSDQSKAIKFFEWVAAYQKQAPHNAKFAGIHLDVEPHVLKEWKTMYDEVILNYQNLLIVSNQWAEGMKLPLVVDIPFWFDKRFYDNAYGSGVLSEWIIDHTDGVTIMAYRDKALGSNGIIELSRTEMDYAATVGKFVSIAVNAKKSSEGEYLTFYEESKQEMNDQLSIVEKAFQHTASFGGFSIHAIDHWMKLK